jgi:hypothetical protein
LRCRSLEIFPWRLFCSFLGRAILNTLRTEARNSEQNEA